MRIAGLIVAAALLGITGCGDTGSDPAASADETTDRPPGCSSTDGIPQGASIELVLNDDAIRPGQKIDFELQATGDKQVITGASYAVGRWHGDRWKPAPGTPRAWTLQAYGISSGSAAPSQSWPLKGADELQPGWYRIVKTATYEGERDIELTTYGCFEVRA